MNKVCLKGFKRLLCNYLLDYLPVFIITHSYNLGLKQMWPGYKYFFAHILFSNLVQTWRLLVLGDM